MKIDPLVEKNIHNFAFFLRENNQTISDREVMHMFIKKYEKPLNVGESSLLLYMLENLKLIDKEKSINKDVTFYQTMHKNLERMS